MANIVFFCLLLFSFGLISAKHERKEDTDLINDVINKLDDLEKKNDDMYVELASLRIKSKDLTDEVEHLKELSKLQVKRTCEEMSQFGVNKSNYYFIDPDGPLTGQDPMEVFCSFDEGKVFTDLSHNSEDMIEVEHCHDPGCYSRKIIYDAHKDQIQALIELSESCEQSIRYDCMLSPLMQEGINYGFWLDKNGQEQIYWDGANAGEHLCACHYSELGCIEEETLHNSCNCDSQIPQEIYDEGKITNMSALPISELRFGGLPYDLQTGFHTLGKLKCRGKAGIEKADSCSALKKDGQFQSGYYNVKEEGVNSKVVFCNMTAPGYFNENIEEFVESSEDHFALVEEEIEVINTNIPNLPGKWSDGSYCILASGACPHGFTKKTGGIPYIKLPSTEDKYLKSVTFGDSYISHSANHIYGDFEIAVCCK